MHNFHHCPRAGHRVLQLVHLLSLALLNLEIPLVSLAQAPFLPFSPEIKVPIPLVFLVFLPFSSKAPIPLAQAPCLLCKASFSNKAPISLISPSFRLFNLCSSSRNSNPFPLVSRRNSRNSSRNSNLLPLVNCSNSKFLILKSKLLDLNNKRTSF